MGQGIQVKLQLHGWIRFCDSDIQQLESLGPIIIHIPENVWLRHYPRHGSLKTHLIHCVKLCEILLSHQIPLFQTYNHLQKRIREKHSRACSNPVRIRLYSLHLHSHAFSCFSLSDVSRLRLSLITCVESSLARLWASCTSAERWASRLSWLTTEKNPTITQSKHWPGFFQIFSVHQCLSITFSLQWLIFFLVLYAQKQLYKNKIVGRNIFNDGMICPDITERY